MSRPCINSLLLPHALDGEGAKYCVFFANFSDFVVVRSFAPRRDLFGAIPNLDNNSLRRMSFERNYVKTCSKNSAACFHDTRLGSWGILIGIAAKFTDSNFGYDVDGGLSCACKICIAELPAPIPKTTANATA